MDEERSGFLKDKECKQSDGFLFSVNDFATETKDEIPQDK